VEKLRVKKINIILKPTIFIKFLIKFYLFTSGIRPLGPVNPKIIPILTLSARAGKTRNIDRIDEINDSFINVLLHN